MPRKKNFILAAAVREVLLDHPESTGGEVFDEVKRRHPKEDINEGSCKVAAVQQRDKLGLRKNAPTASVGGIEVETAFRAKELLKACEGNPEQAYEAIKFVHLLGQR